MATKTFEELKQLAIQIRDEKTNKQNTATRVGTAMLEHINKLEQDYYDKTIINKQAENLNNKIDSQKDEVNAARDEAIEAIDKKEQSVITNFNAQKVTPEMLSESTKQLIEASGGGTITNLPDDEDLESIDDGTGSHVIKLKNRNYNPVNFIGKGYCILRKKISDNKNILTQDMINTPNTIYEVRYEFDLNGQEINIPEFCVMKFNGGSLKNGILNFNKTSFQGERFFYQCRFKGEIDNSYEIRVNDFGVIPNTSEDVTDVLNDLISISSHLYIPDGRYKIRAHDPDREDSSNGYLTAGSGLKLHSNFSLNLSDNTILEAITNSKQQYCIVSIVDSNNVRIFGGTIKGERETHTGVLGEWGYGIYISGSANISIKDIICRDCWGDGVNVQISHSSFKECEDINFYNVHVITIEDKVCP